LKRNNRQPPTANNGNNAIIIQIDLKNIDIYIMLGSNKISFEVSSEKDSHLEKTPLLSPKVDYKSKSNSQLNNTPTNSDFQITAKGLLLFGVSLVILCSILFINPSIKPIIQPKQLDVYKYSVLYNGTSGWYDLSYNKFDNISNAYGTFYPNVNHNGWNYLDIEAIPNDITKDAYLDSMRAMGFIEGFSTYQEITDYYANFNEGMFGTLPPPQCIINFLSDNFMWMETESEIHYKNVEYWMVVKGVLHQLKGLYDGYRVALLNNKLNNKCINNNNWEECLNSALLCSDGHCPKLIDSQHLNQQVLTNIDIPSILHFMILNGNGDLYQIIQKCAELETSPNPFSPLSQTTNFEYIHSKIRKLKKSRLLVNDFESADVNGEISNEEEDVLLTSRDFMITEVGDDDDIPTHILHPGSGEVVTDKIIQDNAFITTPWHRIDHCSAFVKLFITDDIQNGPTIDDIAIGHNTWDDFRNAGPRIMKHYMYKNAIEEKQDGSTSNHPETYFSSSPGLLTSVDDFYTVFTRGTYADNLYKGQTFAHPQRGRFSVVETSLDVYNPEALALINPFTLPSWMRVRAANLMAIDGNDWARLFAFEASGTYSNQWMILDYSKLYNVPLMDSSNDKSKKKDKKRKDNSLQRWVGEGLFTVVEEMPGMIHYADMTTKLLVIYISCYCSSSMLYYVLCYSN
jgi:hypothetical protein